MSAKTTETAKTTTVTASPNPIPPNAKGPATGAGAKRAPRVISRPNDVAALLLAQMNTVNAKKDDLTIAIKQLTDSMQQLVRAYAEHSDMILRLSRRVAELEAEKNKNAGATATPH